jgi:uncharacterized protein YdaU (DUF1376 family)
MKGSPAFQFYPGDYLGSMRVQLLSVEQEGAYLRLLCYCWLHGSIPNNTSACKSLIGKPCFNGGSTNGASDSDMQMVMSLFTRKGKVLTHDRLDAERLKQAAWREKSIAGGKKSAAQRVAPEHTDEGCLPNGSNQRSTLQSSSSSSLGEVSPNNPSTRFLPPTPEAVTEYSRSIAYPLDGQAWCDSYAAKGWMIGKNRMKDWQATVRNWKTNKWKPGESPNHENNDRSHGRGFAQSGDYSQVTDKR